MCIAILFVYSSQKRTKTCSKTSFGLQKMDFSAVRGDEEKVPVKVKDPKAEREAWGLGCSRDPRENR